MEEFKPLDNPDQLFQEAAEKASQHGFPGDGFGLRRLMQDLYRKIQNDNNRMNDGMGSADPSVPEERTQWDQLRTILSENGLFSRLEKHIS